jgi:hypothetical protein
MSFRGDGGIAGNTMSYDTPEFCPRIDWIRTGYRQIISTAQQKKE